VRFVLDYDVDVGVCELLRNAGHECWRAPEGLIEDDDISVYSDDKNAALVSHDREFAYRRQRRTFGQHVRLACQQPDAINVLGSQLDELVEFLGQHPVGVFVVTRASVEFKPPRWE
jgi:hypothetical protein